MRPPDALYLPVLNAPTVNQEAVAKAAFELTQELRKAAADGDLSPVEVFTVAVSRLPGAVAAIVAAMRDETAVAADVEEVAHIVIQQLGLLD